LSNDGKLLATATPDEVKIWNLESPTTSKTIKVDSPPLTSLSFSGDSILATSSGYEILLWKLDSLGSPEQRYTPAYLTMSESERREKLTSLQNQYTEVKKELDKAIIIGRLGEDLERIQGELQLFSKRRLAHSEDILTISFESPSAKLLSVGVDGVLKVWDASALSEIRRTSVGRLKSYDNHTYVATNGKYLAYISEKYFNSVDLFSISDEKYIRTFSAVPPFALSSDGRLLATQATGLGFAPCFLYDCQTGTGYDLDGNPTNAVIFRFSFDGKVLACLHTGGHVNLWRVISRNLHPTGLSGADSKTGIHKVPLELDKNFPKESGVFIKKSENTSNGSGKHESREQIQEWQSELSNLQVDYDQRSREYERKKDILNENTKAAIEKELRQLRDRVEDLKKKIAGKN
jgi:WD40 repeat protein